MKKSWIIALYAMVILAAVALLVYEIYDTGSISTAKLLRSGIIVLGAVLGIGKTVNGKRRKVFVNKTAVFDKAYEKEIGNAFRSMPKERKQFDKALADMNNDKNEAAIKTLSALEENCRGVAEQRALTFFIGRNYEKLHEFEEAKTYYERCLRMGGNEKAANNLATCYQHLGDLDKEWESLQLAVHLNPQYANGYNNMGQFLIRMGEYEEAIGPLQEAHRLNSTLSIPLAGLAICYAMIDEKENYEKSLRQAVTLGYNGAELKEFIRSLEPPFAL